MVVSGSDTGSGLEVVGGATRIAAPPASTGPSTPDSPADSDSISPGSGALSPFPRAPASGTDDAPPGSGVGARTAPLATPPTATSSARTGALNTQRTSNPPPVSMLSAPCRRGSPAASPDASGTSAGASHAIGATPGLAAGQRSNATVPLSNRRFSARVHATY